MKRSVSLSLLVFLVGIALWVLMPGARAESDTLVVYFSMPEDVDTVDAVAGASIVVKDGEKLGNLQFAAQTIADTLGADLFRLETVQQYPLEHNALVDQAADEQDENLRPALAALPDVTAYILTGILIGPYCLNLIPASVISGYYFRYRAGVHCVQCRRVF